MRRESHNLHGSGDQEHEVYDMPVVDPRNYWSCVTDVPCPVAGCGQTIVWYEAGYVPGYRVCMAELAPEPIRDARAQLDAWDPDEEEQSTIYDVFRAIYCRRPADDDNAVDLIYAAIDCLSAEESIDVLRILYPTWSGFRAARPPHYDPDTLRHRFIADRLGAASAPRLVRDDCCEEGDGE